MADYDDALIERAEEAHWWAWSFNAAEKAGIRDPQSHNALMVRAVLDAVADDLRAEAWTKGYVHGHRQACPGACTHGVARNPYREEADRG